MTLEILKLLIGASVPLLIAYFGWRFSNRLKSIDHYQWQNRKIIELRLDLYKEISPKLNSMFCYCMWIGDWKFISPIDMINFKRNTDKTVNVYRHLLSENFYKSYNIFIHSVFQTFNGPGEDAKIRSAIKGPDGDRRVAFQEKWQADWDNVFAPDKPVRKEEIFQNYTNLMNEFRTCIGLKEADLK